ncbi:MAG: peptidase M4 [Alphaproteobacteria bacterium]
MAGPNSYPRPTARPLVVYGLDPSYGRRLNNYMTIKAPYEPLEPGPVGRKIAVVDYDASNGRYYEPVDLNNRSVLIRGGLEPSESDPRFHQQMVYAVASETVRRFEFALGREVKWRRSAQRRPNDPYRHRLRIFPHAFQQANAFYDKNLRAVLLGYFAASESDAGSNLPGQTIFTCLSHDIIAHEVTHAVIDGVRQHFLESTSPDTPAFHEAFADIVALFQHFSMREAVIDTIRRTGGLLHHPKLAGDVAPAAEPLVDAELTSDNPLVGLAQQFGEAMGLRKALRSAIGTPPNSKDIEQVFEPHLRGAILVAAVFNAYLSIYFKRTRDLFRIARAGGGIDAQGELNADLAERLCNEAVKTADHVLNICIRAVDYCPPVDLQFGEFLRALITADADLVPEDRWDYRAEFIRAFRLRGIVPEDVISYSEEALKWDGPIETGAPLRPCKGLSYDLLKEVDEEARDINRVRQSRNAVTLFNYATENAAALGLRPMLGKDDPKIQVKSFHPIYRIGPDGRMVVDFVVEFLQKREEQSDPSDKGSPKFVFRGGSTVIFAHDGAVRYVIRKSIDSTSRLVRQRQFVDRLGEISPLAIYHPEEALELGLAAVHRGF